MSFRHTTQKGFLGSKSTHDLCELVGDESCMGFIQDTEPELYSTNPCHLTGVVLTGILLGSGSCMLTVYYVEAINLVKDIDARS